MNPRGICIAQLVALHVRPVGEREDAASPGLVCRDVLWGEGNLNFSTKRRVG